MFASVVSIGISSIHPTAFVHVCSSLIFCRHQHRDVPRCLPPLPPTPAEKSNRPCHYRLPWEPTATAHVFVLLGKKEPGWDLSCLQVSKILGSNQASHFGIYKIFKIRNLLSIGILKTCQESRNFLFFYKSMKTVIICAGLGLRMQYWVRTLCFIGFLKKQPESRYIVFELSDYILKA